MLTLEKFKKIFPQTKDADTLLINLNKMFAEYEINTPNRIAMFLAQCGHESGQFNVMQENLNYRAERLLQVFPKYFRGVDVKAYAHNPQKIANRVYANRMGNGDEKSGDGYRYRGRGFIQLTGRENYTKAGYGDNPDAVATQTGAAETAGWYWKSRKLNSFADKKDVTGATKAINGGIIGLAERKSLFEKISKIID